jgi:hypothetical protein
MKDQCGPGPWVFFCTYSNRVSIVRGPTLDWTHVEGWLKTFRDAGHIAIYTEKYRCEPQAPSYGTQAL